MLFDLKLPEYSYFSGIKFESSLSNKHVKFENKLADLPPSERLIVSLASFASFVFRVSLALLALHSMKF